MVDYIIEYQNNFVSSYLFLNNLRDLIEKEVELSGLLNSNVFSFTFDYDEWPSTHSDEKKYIRPYNGSIFEIRNHYRSIFVEDRFEIIDEDVVAVEKVDSSKVYKISYQINVLPKLSEYITENPETGEITFVNEDVSLMEMCFNSNELELFKTKTIIQLLEFKWESFAFKIHSIGLIMHFFYMTVLFLYI